jgi:hypothetical protein
MNTNELEARVSKLEKSVLDLHSTNLKLVNQELVLRGMMHTLLCHMSDEQRTTLGRTYGMYLTSILEQVPPDIQNREILQEFDDVLSQHPDKPVAD